MHVIKRARQERGQAIIMFVLIFTVIAVVGAVAVDFGLWWSERRGAQTDADLSALAGAYELFQPTPSVSVPAAIDTAESYVDDNNESGNASLAQPVEVGYDCFGDESDRPNSVTVDVNHQSRALFGGIFGVAAPDIGAHAKACAGSLRSTTGLKPWAISVDYANCFVDGVPQFGADCYFRLDDTPLTGAVRLGNEEGDACDEGQGGNIYGDNILDGSAAVCSIGDLIRSEPGNITQTTWDSVAEMISGEGECDALNGNGDGIDQFDEAYESAFGVPGPDEVFTARNCTTPRAISIIIVNQAPDGPSDYQPILGFAAFYIIRCETIAPDDTVTEYEDCVIPNNEASDARLYGRFMRVLELDGDIGDFDPFGTNVIRLVE